MMPSAASCSSTGQSDMSFTHFPLMRLPLEIRRRIYESALDVDTGRDILPTKKEPSLLQSCKQIRDDGTSLFYFYNSVTLQCRDFEPSWKTSEQLDPGVVQSLNVLGPEYVANFRHVSFRHTIINKFDCVAIRGTYRIEIDLRSKDCSSWRMFLEDEDYLDQGKPVRKIPHTFFTLQDFCGDGEHLAASIKNCVAFAKFAIREFGDECEVESEKGSSLVLRPSSEGLQILAGATSSIVNEVNWFWGKASELQWWG